MKQTPKLKTVTRSVKHVFTVDEIAQKNVDYRNADKSVASLEAEFASVIQPASEGLKKCRRCFADSPQKHRPADVEVRESREEWDKQPND